MAYAVSSPLFIDSREGTNLKLLSDENCFDIIVHNKRYHCNIFGVQSSNVLKQFLQQNPEKREYIYQFRGSTEYFQLICDFFNFQVFEITPDNFESLKEIATNLEIKQILDKVNKFSENNEKLDRDITSIEEIFHLLYHIKQKTVEFVANKILDSDLIQSTTKLKDFASFFLHVVRTSFYLQPYLIDLLISLDKEAAQIANLQFLKQFLINFFLNNFPQSQFYCCFLCHLAQKGYISMDQIITQIIINTNFTPPKDQNQNLKLVQSNTNKNVGSMWGGTSWSTSNNASLLGTTWGSRANPNQRVSPFPLHLIETAQNRLSLYQRNIFIWFYSELMQNGRQFIILNNNADLKTFFDYWTKISLEKYRHFRDSYLPISPISQAIFNDDIDFLQSIVETQSIPVTSYTIPYELFQPVEAGPKNLLDLAAECGSVQCFKYLLLNQCPISECTASYAVYSGNTEIIHLIDEKSPQSFRNNLYIPPIAQNDTNLPLNFLFIKKSFMSPVLIAILMHHNAIFDWILSFYNQSYKQEDLLFMAYVSVQSNNFYSFLSCIEKGLNLTNNLAYLNLFLRISASFGYYQLTDFILKLCTPGDKISVGNAISNFNYLELFELFIDFEKFRIDPHFLLNDSLKKGYLDIAKFILDKYSFEITKYFVVDMINSSVYDQLGNSFHFLLAKFDFLNIEAKYHLDFGESKRLLISSCSKPNFFVFQKIFDFFVANFTISSITTIFLEACYSGSEQIVKYCLSKKLPIDCRVIIDHHYKIFLSNWKIAVLLIDIIDVSLQQSFIQLLINSCLKFMNKTAFKELMLKSADQKSILFHAMVFNDAELIKIILSHTKQFLNYVSENGAVIHISILNKYLDIAKFLITIPEIDINICTFNNETPLTMAVESNLQEIVFGILNHKQFDPVKSKLNGSFVKCTQLDILQLLVSNDNLDVNYQFSASIQLNNSKVTTVKSVLLHSISQQQWPKCELIISHPKFDPYKSNALEALRHFMLSNNLELFELLFQKYNNDKSQILNESIQSKSFAICKIILSHCPNLVNHLFEYGTVLHYSIIHNYNDFIKYLMSIRELNVNISNCDNQTALTLASELDLKLIVPLIMKHHSFNFIESNINFAFFIANDDVILTQFAQFSDLNVNYQYDSSITTKDTSITSIDTSLIYALRKNNLRKMDLIISHRNFDPIKSCAKRAIFYLIDKTQISIFRKLIGKINDVNFCSYNGEYFLSYLAYHGKINLLEIIFSMNLTIDDDYLIDLLILLLEKQNTTVDFINGLIQFDKMSNHCFDFQNLLPNGKSFFTAVNASNPNISSLFQLFLQNGVDPNAPDANNCYPFEYAITTNSTQLVQTLINSGAIDYSKKLSLNNTYLHIAARTSKQMYDFLSKFHLFPSNAKNDAGQTPLDVCNSKRSANGWCGGYGGWSTTTTVWK